MKKQTKCFISMLYSGVPVSAVCVYPANNSVEDSTGRFGRNGGVFDIFRTLLVNPNTNTQTTSGYVEVSTSFGKQYLHMKKLNAIITLVLHVGNVKSTFVSNDAWHKGLNCRCFRECNLNLSVDFKPPILVHTKWKFSKTRLHLH